MNKQVEQWLAQLTLEEKASLLAGANMWMTKGIPRLGIAPVEMYDGTNGVRKPGSPEELGMFGDNMPATCYPTGSALGASWDEDLLGQIGVALGQECRQLGVRLLLGPGINMKRSPLSGRNFEYYSEDPCLSGELAAAFINGLQSQGVGASLKHYACNNSEYRKMVTSSEVDERTLREIYLNAFERVVKKADPWTIMCSYNLINGVYASENEHLLQEILRQEWGYDGVVISDWTAVHDRVRGVKAGLDLEMPGPAHYHTRILTEAVGSGALPEAALDDSVRRILSLVLKTVAGEQGQSDGISSGMGVSDGGIDAEAGHRLARQAARESMVLLKNEAALLPLDPSAPGTIAVIGKLAAVPRIQGGGSARVTPTQVDIPLEEIKRIADAGERNPVSYHEGYDEGGAGIDGRLIDEAVRAAQAAHTALLFVGQSAGTESEGVDSDRIDLPAGQIALIRAVAAVQPNTVVLVSNGAAVAMQEWIAEVPAVLEMWLCGQGSGGAVAELLFGLANPCGKLPETFPVSLADHPAYSTFQGEDGRSFYDERVYTGYRYYDAKAMEPLFPFGHGLSYTRFEYSELQVSWAGETATVSCLIRNTGDRAGKEVVQVYVADPERGQMRPPKELKAFRKVDLQPGASVRVEVKLERRDFAYYDTSVRQWRADSSIYEILVGSSSRDIRLAMTVTPPAVSCESAKPVLLPHMLLKDWLAHPAARQTIVDCLQQMSLHNQENLSLDAEFEKFFGDWPVVKLIQLYGQEWLGTQTPADKVREMIGQAGK